MQRKNDNLGSQFRCDDQFANICYDQIIISSLGTEFKLLELNRERERAEGEQNKLKYLRLHDNTVMDLSAVDYLKAKGCFRNGLYTDRQTQPSQQEIDESRLW
ncbi:Hypothetical_protein [Hexamita inflata]|uniref:Hypothetical_protein n=1 Tax=Hexamita inflata TaxID=28002 RepID=A0AA86P8C3_9EUKA|nr:Hypothetical protein HINF_LOCUS21230 [Hexamita inflata]